MGHYNNNSGCSTTIWIILVVPMLLFLIGKGCISFIGSIDTHTNNSKTYSQPKKENNHKWGEKGVDPVLRTSSGGIYKDPNYPNHYFDITMPCHQCNGKGSWESLRVNPDISDSKGNIRGNVPVGIKETIKCNACYGTGYEKQPIPADGKIPLKPYPKK